MTRTRTHPDPVDHLLFTQWHRHRAQAHYRGELYELTAEQYQQWWRHEDRYLRRGRVAGSIVMARCRSDQPWHRDNITAISREHLNRVNQHMHNVPDHPLPGAR
jgi:hypothetical protein